MRTFVHVRDGYWATDIAFCRAISSSGAFKGGGRCRAGSVPPPLRRRTDAVTVLLISENDSVLWRRHRQLTYKQVRATHQSLTLSANTASKDDRKSQGWNSASRRPEGVNAKM